MCVCVWDKNNIQQQRTTQFKNVNVFEKKEN